MKTRLEGRKLASPQTDIRDAGGTWVDEEVMVDRGIVTSQSPNDVPAFSEKPVTEIEKSPRA